MKTERTRVKRLPKRGAYDAETVYSIIDEAMICHLGFTVDDQPYVIPTIHARTGDTLVVHGSTASRMIRALEAGAPMCATMTLIDGLVLARSAFHHSMNYRSVVVLGVARAVTNADEKLAALEAIVEHVRPGRWEQCRGPNAKELKATQVLALPITEASAKIRTGPPVDDPEDYALDHWAGVIPVQTVLGEPIVDAATEPPSS